MSAPRKPGFVLPVAVTLAVLVGLYVDWYYAVVSPDFFFSMPRASQRQFSN